MPRKKKLTEQQAASEKIGKILGAKERGEPVHICSEFKDNGNYLSVCVKCGALKDGQETRSWQEELASSELNPTNAPSLLAALFEQFKKDTEGVMDAQEKGKENSPNSTGREARNKPEMAKEDGPKTWLQAWQLGLCERVAQGDALGSILKDYEISNAKFIQERDSNPEFKAKLDEAFGIVAEMVEYSMMNLALTGNATERKNYAPILLEKYGRKMPAQPEEDAPSGESEGL